jgi:hypothetical protein
MSALVVFTLLFNMLCETVGGLAGSLASSSKISFASCLSSSTDGRFHELKYGEFAYLSGRIGDGELLCGWLGREATGGGFLRGGEVVGESSCASSSDFDCSTGSGNNLLTDFPSLDANTGMLSLSHSRSVGKISAIGPELEVECFKSSGVGIG